MDKKIIKANKLKEEVRFADGIVGLRGCLAQYRKAIRSDPSNGLLVHDMRILLALIDLEENK
jgi:hypothetical protein